MTRGKRESPVEIPENQMTTTREAAEIIGMNGRETGTVTGIEGEAEIGTTGTTVGIVMMIAIGKTLLRKRFNERFSVIVVTTVTDAEGIINLFQLSMLFWEFGMYLIKVTKHC